MHDGCLWTGCLLAVVSVLNDRPSVNISTYVLCMSCGHAFDEPVVRCRPCLAQVL